MTKTFAQDQLVSAPAWLQGPLGAAFLAALGGQKDWLVDRLVQAIVARCPGTAVVLRTNYQPNSEAFGQWTLTGCTVTPDLAYAPNMTLTADATVEDGSTGLHGVSEPAITAVVGTPYTFSVHLRAGGRGQAFVALGGGAIAAGDTGAVFDLSTGAVVTTKGGTVLGTTAALVGTSPGLMWRCSVTVQADTSASLGGRVYSAASGNTNLVGNNGVLGFYAWGAQLEVGSSLTAYIPTSGAAGFAYGPGPRSAPSDALALIGQERGIMRGLAENEASYRARLRAAFALWQWAGTAYGLLTALYAAGYPAPMIQTQSGQQLSLNGYTGDPAADLVTSRLPGPVHLGGSPSELWSDVAVFITQPWPSWWSSALAPADGSADQFTVSALVKAWKGAHNRCVQLKAIKGPVVGISITVGSFTVGSATVVAWTPPAG